MIVPLLIGSLLGILLPLYSIWIEARKKRDPAFKPFCDFSENISCTKTLESRWESAFGVPNSLLGIGYYVLMAILAIMDQAQIAFYVAIAGGLFAGSVALILLIQDKVLCVVCSTGLLISIILAYIAYIHI